MTMSFLSKQEQAQILTQFWRDKLINTADPANGRWYDTGPNGIIDVGLYGGLVDRFISRTYDQDDTQTVKEKVMSTLDSFVLNNLSGLSGKSTVSLAMGETVSRDTTVSSESSSGWGLGLEVGQDLKVWNWSLSGDYHHDWSSGKSTSQSSSEAQSGSVSIEMEIPAGKVYKAVLQGDVYKISVPTTVIIKVTGKSETWYEDPVNGHYNHSANAGEIFAFIAEHNLAGDKSSRYSADTDNPDVGVYVMPATLFCDVVDNISTQVTDVTSQYVDEGDATSQSQSSTNGNKKRIIRRVSR